MKFIGGCKSFYHFKECLLEVINLYEKKDVYQERKLSITRSLEFYFIIIEEYDLIIHKDLNIIKKKYKDYLINNTINTQDNIKYIDNIDNYISIRDVTSSESESEKDN
jgi:hypothetical protein